MSWRHVSKKDVDGRDEPGHDENGFISLGLAQGRYGAAASAFLMAATVTSFAMPLTVNPLLF